MSLEDQLIEDIVNGEYSLERALLISSGLSTEKEVQEYVQKLDLIQDGFEEYMSKHVRDEELSQIETARLLFDYLWKINRDMYPKGFWGSIRYYWSVSLMKIFWSSWRYKKHNYLLTDVINGQLSNKKKGFGNCYGLTKLYTVLGLRYNLNLSVLWLPDHVKNRLRDGDTIVDIENNHSDGFGEKDSDEYTEHSPFSLLAYSHLLPYICERLCYHYVVEKVSGDLAKAYEIYDKIIEITISSRSLREQVLINIL
ncbi:MAG: hypothetical protein JRI41_10290 [Deltaproteobacteria bacterium]|nr:hypothetical protein [Deltaproteobacteria bacterium]